MLSVSSSKQSSSNSRTAVVPRLTPFVVIPSDRPCAWKARATRGSGSQTKGSPPRKLTWTSLPDSAAIRTSRRSSEHAEDSGASQRANGNRRSYAQNPQLKLQRVVTRHTTTSRSGCARVGRVSAMFDLSRVALARKRARERHELLPIGHALHIDAELVTRAQDRGVRMLIAFRAAGELLPIRGQIQHEGSAAARSLEGAADHVPAGITALVFVEGARHAIVGNDQHVGGARRGAALLEGITQNVDRKCGRAAKITGEHTEQLLLVAHESRSRVKLPRAAPERRLHARARAQRRETNDGTRQGRKGNQTLRIRHRARAIDVQIQIERLALRLLTVHRAPGALYGGQPG